MDRSTILQRIKTGISEIDPDAKVFLYGSRARGDNRQDSDWDILVITPKEKITFEYESELRDPIYDIELEIGQVISLLVYSELDWKTRMPYSPLFSNVQEEGIRI
jgi:predicted nucleotidyltransferase